MEKIPEIQNRRTADRWYELTLDIYLRIKRSIVPEQGQTELIKNLVPSLVLWALYNRARSTSQRTPQTYVHRPGTRRVN